MEVQNAVMIDGQYFNILIPEGGIKRSFAVTDTDKAGRVLTGAMQRDIIGTFYNYTIQFETRNLSPDEYDDLYRILSAPVDSHNITVPYGQTVLNFNAYVTGGEDTLNRIRKNTNDWSGLSINFIAMEPQRRTGAQTWA